MNYVETYNASEGFFGIQDTTDKNEMLLMLDYGIFYEFIALDDFSKGNMKSVTIGDAKPGINYVMVISTNGGLWRYITGDTIMFTETFPFRFRITGRTKHFINVFGEELISDNTDKAISVACERTGAKVREYTAAPVFMSENKAGGHEWLIEFEKRPENMQFFAEVLDNALKSLNSDYEAKRSYNMNLDFPLVKAVPDGTFYAWLNKRGKLGGQHKVPRLFNTRQYIEEINSFIA